MLPRRAILGPYARACAGLSMWPGVLVATGPALAHVFGACCDVPIPLSPYLGGAGLKVARSFAMLAVLGWRYS